MKPQRSHANVTIINFLRADHSLIRHLCEQYVDARDQDLFFEKKRLAARLCDVLTLQRLVEEEALYPEIRKKNEMLAFDQKMAAQGISASIDEVRNPMLASIDRDAAVARLIDMVRYHIAERETALLPTLEAWFPPARLDLLGANYLQHKLLLRQAPATAGAGPAGRASDRGPERPPVFALVA